MKLACAIAKKNQAAVDNLLHVGNTNKLILISHYLHLHIVFKFTIACFVAVNNRCKY